jgi:peptidoglycan/xylan/chitin deacetylase (PgdA/CDA1 family)
MPDSAARGKIWLVWVAIMVLCGGAYLRWKGHTPRFLMSDSTARAGLMASSSLTAIAEPSVPPSSLTFTPWPSATATPSPQPSETVTSSPTATATLTATPTATTTPTVTATPSPTPWPLPTPDGALRVLQVPILMYHYISVAPLGADAVRQDLSVSPEHFEQQLQYLRAQGYESITLYDLLLAVQTGVPLPPKPVVLTFDDGYRDSYTYAFPLLQRYGYTGAFFLNVAFIDNQYPEYLTWDQVQEMAAAGMDMEAHGYTHPNLCDCDMDALIFQILRPKEAIEARTHQAVRFFCYPSGEYDERVIRVLHSANYWGAVTLISGVEQRSDSSFEWQRIRVRGDYDVQDLDRVLAAYMHSGG